MCGNIIVEKIESDEVGDWEDGLSGFSYSLFLLPKWLEALKNEANRPVFFDFKKDGAVVAKLAGLMCQYGGFRGKQLYFYASPAFSDDTLFCFNLCHSALREWARQNGVSRIIIGSYDQQYENVCAAEGFYPTYRYEYIVAFGNSELPKFSTGFKKNFKKAEKLGATFHQDNTSEMLDKMLDLLGYTRDLRTMKYGRDYDPFYLKGLNEKVLQRLLDNGLGKLYYAKVDGDVSSVQYNIESGGKVYGLLMGSDGFAYKNGLPSFVDYNLICLYNRNGFTYYNPGGGPVDEGGSGIEQYKKSMGGVKFVFAGSTTNFLTYPHKLLNPLLRFGRLLPKSDKGIIGFLKRFV